jgi:glycosyltransferase involved in cell wall biosynthesis
VSGPLLSCIVPCFQGERYLAEALDSILTQTHRPLEIIVVDDGSSDNSSTVVEGFGDRVRYHRQENRGPAGACNTGLGLATGDLVAFLEQDDLWIPDKAVRQLREFEADAGLGYCVGLIHNFWIPELAHEAGRYRDLPVMQPVPGYVVQTLMARRRVFEQVGLFDESLPLAFASDWFLRAADSGVTGHLVPEVLTQRRLHQGNYSRLHRTESREQFLQVVKAALDRRRGREST